jgi:hypothetical protein
MEFKDAQDVLDNYYKQETIIRDPMGWDHINPNFKSLVQMIEEFGEQKYSN